MFAAMLNFLKQYCIVFYSARYKLIEWMLQMYEYLGM
jgi:hypothetical protein